MRFSVLGSGSRGNACLVRGDGPGLLVDAGLGPKAMEARLSRLGLDWGAIGAVVLTHTHGDHVDAGTLNRLARLRVVLHCHEAHRRALAERDALAALEARGLVRTYDERPWITAGGMRVEPIEAHHDAEATFGFRVEGRSGPRRGRSYAVGYLADTGMWTARQAEALADADLIGVEFNHDVAMQRASGRPAHLVRRILGHRGHLSNDQGAELLCAVLARSRPGRVRSLVLLHLSEQCNRPALAVETARRAASQAGRRLAVHVAEAHEAAPDLPLVPPAPRRASARRERVGAAGRSDGWPTLF